MKKKKSRQIERVKKDPSFHILNLGWLHSADTVTTAALLFKLQKGLIIINIIPLHFCLFAYLNISGSSFATSITLQGDRWVLQSDRRPESRFPLRDGCPKKQAQ